MSDTDRLRDLLERAAPLSPDVTAPERTAAVVRRGRAVRRRDQVVVGAATLAVLAAALGVPLALSGGDPQQTTPAPAATVAEPCPAAPVDVATLGAVPALDDVVAVRSCPTTEKPVTALPIRPMLDADAAAFLEDVEAMPAYEMPPACMVMSMAVDPWALQLQTAAGETVLIGSTLRGCSSVEIGGTARAVDQVVAAFLGNLTGTPPIACPTGDDLSGLPTWNASFEPSAAVAGLVCDGSTSTELTADEVAVIADDLAANMVAGPETGQCFEPPSAERVLVLADRAGDQIAYLGRTCTAQMASARGYWTPGPAAEAILSR